MQEEQPLTRAEAQALLGYAEATYRSVTAYRRRVAAAALALAVVFGMLFAVSAFQWVSTRASVDEVVDEPFAEALGVEIPDPRPALERAQLRLAAMLWGVVALITGTLTLLLVGVYLVSRPPAMGRDGVGADP